MPIHIRVNEILTWQLPPCGGCQELVPVLCPIERQCAEIAGRTRLAANPSQRKRTTTLAILKDHRPVPRELQFGIARRRLAAHSNRLPLNSHRLPFVTYPIAVGVIRMSLLDKNVHLIRTDDRHAPSNPLVVADGHAGQSRFSTSNHVPT